MKEDRLKEQYRELVQQLKKQGKEKGTTITNEFIAEALDYERTYFSTLLGGRGKVTKKHIKDLLLHFPTLETPELSIVEEPEMPYGKKLLEQSILNLTEDKLKNTDIMEKLVDDKLRSTAIIENLVAIIKDRGLFDPNLPDPNSKTTQTLTKKSNSTQRS